MDLVSAIDESLQYGPNPAFPLLSRALEKRASFLQIDWTTSALNQWGEHHFFQVISNTSNNWTAENVETFSVNVDVHRVMHLPSLLTDTL